MNNESRQTEEKKVVEFKTIRKGVYSYDEGEWQRKAYEINCPNSCLGIRG